MSADGENGGYMGKLNFSYLESVINQEDHRF